MKRLLQLISLVSCLLSCLAWIQVRTIKIPDELFLIRECREKAFDDPSKIKLDSQRSFVNGDQLTRDGFVGVIAKEKKSPFRVLGTADVNVRTKVINNVFVTPEARGRGIGRALMEAAESVLGQGATVKLNVATNNKNAVRLYESIGYETKGLNGAVSALSAITNWQLEVVMTKEL